MSKQSKKQVKQEFVDVPLGGDYALDANDQPKEVYEDRSGRREVKKNK